MVQKENNNNQDIKSDIILEENKTVSEEKYDNHDYLRTKMEVMQRKIDALKEKVKYEESNLGSEESSIKSFTFDETPPDSSNNSENSILNNENKNEYFHYFSLSNNSLCNNSSSSTEGAYLSFNKFVTNFPKDHDQKERLNLLQFHSNKQISLNMMKHSLSDLSSRCTKELEFIEERLCHLNRLATEFNVNIENCHKNNRVEASDVGNKGHNDVGYKNYNIRNVPRLMWPQFEVPKYMVDGHISAISKLDVKENIPIL